MVAAEKLDVLGSFQMLMLVINVKKYVTGNEQSVPSPNKWMGKQRQDSYLEVSDHIKVLVTKLTEFLATLEAHGVSVYRLFHL